MTSQDSDSTYSQSNLTMPRSQASWHRILEKTKSTAKVMAWATRGRSRAPPHMYSIVGSTEQIVIWEGTIGRIVFRLDASTISHIGGNAYFRADFS